ncbi:MAG: peptidoglycan bridge formation glycyltransferase FemA/FemB family protein [Patescibacteria group bacterium]
MILRPILDNEKDLFNSVVTHPLQSWEWGDFKEKEGATVERVGFFEGNKLKKAIQVFFHKLPYTSSTIGYFPKGVMPDDDQISALRQLAEQNKAITIKLEPNVCQSLDRISAFDSIQAFLKKEGCVPGKALFTRYTFLLPLKGTEEELMAKLKTKTRYNVHLAQKKGVEIVENTTEAGMEAHLEILAETTKRQGFYAHTPSYFKEMWKSLGKSDMLRIFEAKYEGKVLTSWIIFVFHDTLYYPYGSSRSENRDVMASNLMMWEMIRLGKSLDLQTFDMWGALGPDPDPKDPWFGFHRFKQGYGGDLSEFLGTYDLVINPSMYRIYNIADTFRWKVLRTKAAIRRMIPNSK